MKKILDQLIDEVHSALGTLPTLPRHRSLYETIEALAPDIIALRERNYEWDAIAEFLRGKGIQIRANTLRSYLARVASASVPAPARGSSQSPARTPTPHRAPTPPTARIIETSTPVTTTSTSSGGRERGSRRMDPTATAPSPLTQETTASPSDDTTPADADNRSAGYFHAREDTKAL